MRILGGLGKFTIDEVAPLFVASIFIGIPLHAEVASLGEYTIRTFSFAFTNNTETVHAYTVPVQYQKNNTKENALTAPITHPTTASAAFLPTTNNPAHNSSEAYTKALIYTSILESQLRN